MSKQLEKKYGLFTAIAMVVGIVIGSGVFFKAEKILTATGGDLPQGILAWILGGMVMMSCAYVFSILAGRYERVGGIVDYAEVMVGRRYAYAVGWLLAGIYYPALTSVLAFVTARYTCVLLGWEVGGGSCMIIAAFFLIFSFTVNTLAPKLAGKVQVSTTVIKLIPMILMAVIGTVFGIKSGVMIENFTMGAVVEVAGNPLFAAVVATAFAYEGWIVATSINAELHDAKRNLPKALMIGTGFIVLIYLCYYIGLAGAVENQVMMASGETGAKIAFSNIFGSYGGTMLFVLIVISCFGTLNGLMLGCTRGFYAVAVRNEGPNPPMFRQIDEYSNMPNNSAVMGLLAAIFWLTYFYGANLAPESWFGKYGFDSSELPIVTLYAVYIPIFFNMMRVEKDLHPLKRYVFPIIAIIASIFMLVATVYAHGIGVAYYLVLFVIIMAIGLPFMNKGKTQADIKNKAEK